VSGGGPSRVLCLSFGGLLQVVDGPGIVSCGDRAEQSAEHLTLRGVRCAMVVP
jgi:hypothetical protein